MPCLPLYCSEQDIPSLLGILGEDIAFIVPDGEKKWRAVAQFVPKPKSRTALWHVPSGPLPLKGAIYVNPVGIPDAMPDGVIEDPWSGWKEERAGADPTAPWFGPGHPGIFWLNLRISGRDPESSCGVSSFEWIGNRYPDGAPKITLNRWAKLKRQVAKFARRVPRGGLGVEGVPEIWAFPYALEDLEVADKDQYV